MVKWQWSRHRLCLSPHCRLCSVFQTNAVPAPMIPWYGFLLGALTPQLCSPFKIPFFKKLLFKYLPLEPLPALALLYTLFEGPPLGISYQWRFPDMYLEPKFNPQSSETSYTFPYWTSLLEWPTVAQSACPLLTKLSVFFFLCSLDHQIIPSSRHQAHLIFKKRSLTEPGACISLRLISSTPGSGL